MSHNHHGNLSLAHRIFDMIKTGYTDCIKDSQNSFGSNFLSGSPVSRDDSTNVSRWAFDRSSESRRHNRVSGVFDTKHVTRATRFQYSDRARTNSTEVAWSAHCIPASCRPSSGKDTTSEIVSMFCVYFEIMTDFHTHIYMIFRSCVCNSRRMEKFLGYILCDAENADCECIEKENLWFFLIVGIKFYWKYSEYSELILL